jgi:hypothetical protein
MLLLLQQLAGGFMCMWRMALLCMRVMLSPTTNI